jgi:WD40 repeat protein
VVSSAQFSKDGSRILTTSFDGTARLWLADTDDLIQLADSRITRGFTAEELTRYAEFFGDE